MTPAEQDREHFSGYLHGLLVGTPLGVLLTVFALLVARRFGWLP